MGSIVNPLEGLSSPLIEFDAIENPNSFDGASHKGNPFDGDSCADEESGSAEEQVETYNDTNELLGSQNKTSLWIRVAKLWATKKQNILALTIGIAIFVCLILVVGCIHLDEKIESKGKSKVSVRGKELHLLN